MKKRISQCIIKPVKLMLFLTTVVMVLLVAAQVIFRHLQITVVWTEEIARILFVWMMSFGIVLVEEENSQVSTELLVNRFSPKVYLVWKGIICILECIFMAVMFVCCIKSLPQVKMINLGTIRALDYRLLYYPMIVSAPLTIWYLIDQWLEILKRGGKREEEA